MIIIIKCDLGGNQWRRQRLSIVVSLVARPYRGHGARSIQPRLLCGETVGGQRYCAS